MRTAFNYPSFESGNEWYYDFLLRMLKRQQKNSLPTMERTQWSADLCMCC